MFITQSTQILYGILQSTSFKTWTQIKIIRQFYRVFLTPAGKT